MRTLHNRIAESFERQRLLATLGARLVRVADGEVDIELPFSEGVQQQHGFAHAGAIATIADSACGYACLTRMPEGSAVLSIEFKVNLLAPAVGERFVARGRAVRVGRTIGVATAEVFAQPPVSPTRPWRSCRRHDAGGAAQRCGRVRRAEAHSSMARICSRDVSRPV